jgi:hypothetical protein
MKILVDDAKLQKVAELLSGPSIDVPFARNIVAKILRESLTEKQKIELDKYLAQQQRDWMD